MISLEKGFMYVKVRESKHVMQSQKSIGVTPLYYIPLKGNSTYFTYESVFTLQ